MFGTNLVGIMVTSNAQRDAREAHDDALHYAREAGEAEGKLNRYIFRAKSHVHGLRAQVYAHRQTEDKLIAALKAENANHPLASKEAVEAAVYDAEVRALVDPEVIKRTYPDGKLPEGAVTPPDETYLIA